VVFLVCRIQAQLEELCNKTAGQEFEVQTLRKQLREKEAPRSPFKDAAILDALPRLPHTSVNVSASMLSPKQTRTTMQCLLSLSQKLQQDSNLPLPAQKIVSKLLLAAQVLQQEVEIRKHREEMLITFVRDQHSSRKRPT
jgi:hypothetical protein